MAAAPAYASFGFQWTDLDGNVFTPATRGVTPQYTVVVRGNLPFPVAYEAVGA
jgi:hypothetical protein